MGRAQQHPSRVDRSLVNRFVIDRRRENIQITKPRRIYRYARRHSRLKLRRVITKPKTWGYRRVDEFLAEKLMYNCCTFYCTTVKVSFDYTVPCNVVNK